jgi:hypothetical protein
MELHGELKVPVTRRMAWICLIPKPERTTKKTDRYIHRLAHFLLNLQLEVADTLIVQAARPAPPLSSAGLAGLL